MTEIVQYEPSPSLLAQQMDYSRAVASGDLLPVAYRGKPANVLLAIGLGQAMGLSPAESLYRIHVIQGRPTASAELIAANVRRAGHKLRVQGDDKTGVLAQIIRADDPEFTFTSRWDMDRARQMGLAARDSWKTQPGTMMRWRAITEVARLACPEALYGVVYVADEVSDAVHHHAEPAARVTAAEIIRQAAPKPPPTDDDGAVVPAGGASATAEPAAEPAPSSRPRMTARQRGKMFALFGDAGISDEGNQRDYISNAIGRRVESRGELTADECGVVVDLLQRDVTDLAEPPEDEP